MAPKADPASRILLEGHFPKTDESERSPCVVWLSSRLTADKDASLSVQPMGIDALRI